MCGEEVRRQRVATHTEWGQQNDDGTATATHGRRARCRTGGRRVPDRHAPGGRELDRRGPDAPAATASRSEERRVGKEGGCRRAAGEEKKTRRGWARGTQTADAH